MLYSAAQPLIQSGDLLAFSNGRFVSRLIRTWTGGSFSHVGVALRQGDDVFMVSARETRGVTREPLDHLLPAYWLATGVTWADEVECFALGCLGRSYSYLDAIRVALGRAPRRDDAVCSVYAATILHLAGIPLPLPSYTPSALVDTLLGAGAELREILPERTP